MNHFGPLVRLREWWYGPPRDDEPEIPESVAEAQAIRAEIAGRRRALEIQRDVMLRRLDKKKT